MTCFNVDISKKFSNSICNVFDIKKEPGKYTRISQEIEKITRDSIKCQDEYDYTEAFSIWHMKENYLPNKDNETRMYSEYTYQDHYNKTVGPNTIHKSTPDGAIYDFIDESANIHLCSVFRYTNDGFGKICRKIEKLLYVALYEHNPSTSLFLEKYKDIKINKITLNFYIWIPNFYSINPVRNILKVIHKHINLLIPELLQLNFNIIETDKSVDYLFWKNNDICFYIEPRHCKMKKLKKINDIINVLDKFFNYDIFEVLVNTLFCELFLE